MMLGTTGVYGTWRILAEVTQQHLLLQQMALSVVDLSVEGTDLCTTW